MKNIFFLHGGEYSRRLPCILFSIAHLNDASPNTDGSRFIEDNGTYDSIFMIGPRVMG
jgi:hypothetical protein